MKTIIEQGDIIASLLGEQEIKNDTEYRPLKYLKTASVEGGMLISNLLTTEAIFLSNDEITSLENNSNIDNDLFRELIKKWFIVPVYTNDLSLSKQIEVLILSVNKIYIDPKIKAFTILPTTDCNARCFYCYEMGCSRKWMTEQTAEDVVKYILRKKIDGKIQLHWFGGEPLYNSKIIDLICTRLTEYGVDFQSMMVSNSYLFDEEMVKKAKELWKLVKVQITLDGTEEIYNKTKAYIYKDCESPFKRVIRNMELLLKEGVRINVRLNMDMHNVDDLFSLTDYLLEHFGKYENLHIYSHLLYEDDNVVKDADYETKRRFLIKENKRLSDYIEKNKKQYFVYVSKIKFKNHCLADRDDSILVLPDGHLGKCEHFIDSNFVGSIYSNEIDMECLNWFKHVSTILPKCDDCDLRPGCISLNCCPTVKQTCSQFDKAQKEMNHMDFVIRNYRYLEEHKDEIKL